MVKRALKKKKPGTTAAGGVRRKERRFATSSTFMPLWVAILGLVACFALGMGVFGFWILDPAASYASYLISAGALGLGVALWLGQPKESAVSVGDAGIAVEDGRQTSRIHWYAMRSLRVETGKVLVEAKSQKLTFLLGANRAATALVLKEAAVRVPDILDVDRTVIETLPNPDEVRGFSSEVEDDQLTGSRCAASKKLITLEEDARICPRCGQVYHRESVPETCSSCATELKGRMLLP